MLSPGTTTSRPAAVLKQTNQLARKNRLINDLGSTTPGITPREETDVLISAKKIYNLNLMGDVILLFAVTILVITTKALTSLDKSKKSPTGVDIELLRELESSAFFKGLLELVEPNFERLLERAQRILRLAWLCFYSI